jgi:hypothetical protein
MLSTTGKDPQGATGRLYSAVFFRPNEEAGLLRCNTPCATGVICIVIWSWRTASSREVSACVKRA